MARETTLTELARMFRDEVGVTSSPSVGGDWENIVFGLLRRTQMMLADEYDWPFLRVALDKPVNRGQRYYDLPDTLDMERISGVHYRNADRWELLERGIALAHYNELDPELDQRFDRLLRWDVYGARQIEVWPLPAGDSLMRIEGVRKLAPLENGGDRADLDDRLIVLFAAAEWLMSDAKRRALGEVKMSHARNRLARLRGASANRAIVDLTGYSKTAKQPGKVVTVTYKT